VAFSVLQAAKRNGGGVFVAFVVVGVAEKSGFTVALVVSRSIGRATTIPFGGQGRWWLARAGESEWGGLCLARAGRPNGIRDSQGHVKNEKASFMMIRGCFLGVCSFQKPSCRLFVHRPLQISAIFVHLKINS